MLPCQLAAMKLFIIINLFQVTFVYGFSLQ